MKAPRETKSILHSQGEETVLAEGSSALFMEGIRVLLNDGVL